MPPSAQNGRQESGRTQVATDIKLAGSFVLVFESDTRTSTVAITPCGQNTDPSGYITIENGHCVRKFPEMSKSASDIGNVPPNANAGSMGDSGRWTPWPRDPTLSSSSRPSSPASVQRSVIDSWSFMLTHTTNVDTGQAPVAAARSEPDRPNRAHCPAPPLRPLTAPPAQPT